MPIYDKAFYVAVFFILGVALASLVSVWMVSLAAAILGAALITLVATGGFYVFRQLVLAGLAGFIFLGASYYFIYDAIQQASPPIFNEAVHFDGMVAQTTTAGSGQELAVNNLRLYLPRFPVYEYGDYVFVEGVVKPPSEEQKLRWLKDGVAGMMSYPQVKLIAKNRGNFALARLYQWRDFTEKTLKQILPYEKAVFMAGLLLGSRADFSREFRNQLARSGTSHLVALSGYNIAVIIEGLGLLLCGWFARRSAFAITVIFITLFVLMTGAAASLVRAALMGIIVLVADQVGRRHSLRNSIVLVAAFMLILNPRLLVFDIGFELSFLAFLGIALLRPIVRRWLRLKFESGFLNWRDNLSATIAAQLAVAPILLLTFDSLSVSGIVANVLILTFVPMAMLAGFLALIASFLSTYLALAVGIIPSLLLSYIIGVIKFFGDLNLTVAWPNVGPFFAIGYYALLAAVIYYYQFVKPLRSLLAEPHEAA